MSKRLIPKKNYIILLGLIILVICGCLAFYNIYNITIENKLSVSPLSDNREILYTELKTATKEIGSDTILVISYVRDRDVYAKEKEIKKYLNKIDMLDSITYLNISDYMLEDNFLSDINKTLKLDSKNEIKKVPALVYFKDGSATYVSDSRDHILNKGDFEQLIDMYDLDH